MDTNQIEPKSNCSKKMLIFEGGDENDANEGRRQSIAMSS